MEDPLNIYRPERRPPVTHELSDEYFVLNYGINQYGLKFIHIQRHDTHLRSSPEVFRIDEEGLLLTEQEMVEIAKRYGFDIAKKPNQEHQVVFFKKTPKPDENGNRDDITKNNSSKNL